MEERESRRGDGPPTGRVLKTDGGGRKRPQVPRVKNTPDRASLSSGMLNSPLSRGKLKTGENRRREKPVVMSLGVEGVGRVGMSAAFGVRLGG